MMDYLSSGGAPAPSSEHPHQARGTARARSRERMGSDAKTLAKTKADDGDEATATTAEAMLIGHNFSPRVGRIDTEAVMRAQINLRGTNN